MALVVTAIAAVLVRRWIMVPLASLTAAVRRIRSGLPAAVTPQGPPELRQVATAVDEMQRTITQQRDDAIRAREAIEQSAILAVQVRSELAGDLGDYPDGWTMAAGLRAAEGIVAGDCYDVSLISPTTIAIDRPRHRGSRRAERGRRAQVQGAAEGRAPLRPRAGRVAVLAERAGAWPGRALPHRVPRGPRHCERPRHLRQRRATRTRSCATGASARTARADRPDRRARSSRPGRPGRWPSIPAGQADHLHRRPRRSPRPRIEPSTARPASWTCS